MTPLLLALPGNEAMAARLGKTIGADIAEFGQFPDGESHVRLLSGVSGRPLVIVATLDRPDAKFLPLAFTAATARELGATQVGLVAPYLAYMRQDRRFREGEAVSARLFANEISSIADWLVTVDPHLHRIHDLASIYSIPAVSLHAAPLLAAWIAQHVQSPLLVGPDEESAQWVEAVAKDAGAPFVVLEKRRNSDTDVEVTVPDVARWRDHAPVLVDDIVSTARTMIETLGHLNRAAMKPAICVGVHAVFAPGAYEALKAAGPARIVTANTIPHETNAIDVAPALAAAVQDLMAHPSTGLGWEITQKSSC